MAQSKARRGKQWEKIIGDTFDLMYPETTITKTDPPVKIIGETRGARFEGIFSGPGMCDFEGCWAGSAVCLEAKDCRAKGRIFLMERIRDHQWERMHATWRMGGISGLLLRFWDENPERHTLVLADFYRLMCLFQDKKRFTADELMAVGRQGQYWILSYRALPGGRLGLRNVAKALDYLKDCDKSLAGGDPWHGIRG